MKNRANRAIVIGWHLSTKNPLLMLRKYGMGGGNLAKTYLIAFGSISKNKYHLYCSECRNQAFNKSTDNDCDFDMDTPFCPWCGAKMDKEETNDKKQPEEAPWK